MKLRLSAIYEFVIISDRKTISQRPFTFFIRFEVHNSRHWIFSLGSISSILGRGRAAAAKASRLFVNNSGKISGVIFSPRNASNAFTKASGSLPSMFWNDSWLSSNSNGWAALRIKDSRHTASMLQVNPLMDHLHFTRFFNFIMNPNSIVFYERHRSSLYLSQLIGIAT